VTEIDRETVRQIIRKELPALLREDRALRLEMAELLADVLITRRDHEAGIAELSRTLTQLNATLREVQAQLVQLNRRVDHLEARLAHLEDRIDHLEARLESLERRMEHLETRMDSLEARLENLERRMEHLEARMEHLETRMDSLEARLERLEEGQKRLEEGQARLERGQKRLEDRILVIGGRWGLKNEAAFRNALRGMLAGLGYKVERYETWDASGQVHGFPAQVEIDLVVRDGELWLIEIKGRVSGSDLFTFMRKVRFYEGQTGQRATRRIIIAPIIEESAQKRAQEEGIEWYAAPDEVPVEEEASPEGQEPGGKG